MACCITASLLPTWWGRHRLTVDHGYIYTPHSQYYSFDTVFYCCDNLYFNNYLYPIGDYVRNWWCAVSTDLGRDPRFQNRGLYHIPSWCWTIVVVCPQVSRCFQQWKRFWTLSLGNTIWDRRTHTRIVLCQDVSMAVTFRCTEVRVRWAIFGVIRFLNVQIIKWSQMSEYML